MKREEPSRDDAQFTYKGPINLGARTQPQTALSAETARVVALSAWRAPGRLHRTPHFLKRVRERNFSILDLEYVIKYGRVVSGPTFCQEHGNYKYYFAAEVDGFVLKVAFALDPTQDYKASPLVVLITGVWNTRSGARNK